MEDEQREDEQREDEQTTLLLAGVGTYYTNVTQGMVQTESAIFIYMYICNVPLIRDKDNMIKGIIRVFRSNTFNTSSLQKLVVALRVSSFLFFLLLHFTQKLLNTNGIINK